MKSTKKRFNAGMRESLAMAIAVFAVAWSGCARFDVGEPHGRVREFRALLQEEDFSKARSLMAPDPRRWWGHRDREGSRWLLGETQGWAAWDRHFRSRKEVVRWDAGEQRVTALIRETNDYYALLERPPVLNEATYFLDDQGRIEGLLIRAVGERPQGRTDEFIAWAKENAPDEIAVLMPEGEIDPSGENPRRFRELLNRWRRDVGLAPIE